MSIADPLVRADRAPLFLAEYQRAHGVHGFSTSQGDVITAVSAPSWEDFAGMLSDLPASTPGYIMSPELMTCAGADLSEIADMQTVVAERTDEVVSISRVHPGAVIALGSVTLGKSGLVNQLEVIQNGEKVGAIHKNALTYDEEEIFAKGSTESTRWTQGEATQFAICAEIIRVGLNRGRSNETLIPEHRSNVLNHKAASLLVSSCWAVPLAVRHEAQYAQYRPPDEVRYRGQLERVVQWIFESYPNLQDIVMTDRRPAGGTIEPLNAHFRRTDGQA